MPVVKRTVQPSALCKNSIPYHVNNELECITNNTLSGAILQLSSLSVHAEDMFGELFSEANSFYSRANSLQGRIDNLTDKVTRLDSSVEEVSLHDINMRKAFRSNVRADQQVVSRETLLESLKILYNMADGPPPLHILSKFRDDGRDALKIYTDPDYFFNLWRDAIRKEMKDAKEKRRELKRREKKAQPRYRQERKVKEAVPRSRIKAEKWQRGVEFVDAPTIVRKKSEEEAYHRQRIISSQPNHSAQTPSYGASPPSIPRYNELTTREERRYTPPVQAPPTPMYHDPPPQYTDLPEPPLPPPMQMSRMTPDYIPPMPPPLPPSTPRRTSEAEEVVTTSSPSPVSHSMYSLNSLPPAPAPPPMDIAPPPPPLPPPLSEEEDSSPAHQSEMAKMLASVQLNKVEERERPEPVMDSRSELLQAIRVGQSLKKVEEQEKSSASFLYSNDVAAILARRIAVLLTDSESESYSDEDETEWDD